MTRPCLLTAGEEDTVERGEAVAAVPGVGAAGLCVQAEVLTLTLGSDTFYHLHNVCFVTVTLNLFTASAASRATDTVHTAGLVVDAGEEKTEELEMVGIVRIPGEGCATLRICAEGLAQVRGVYGVVRVENI